MNLDVFYANVYKLSFITRYSNQIRITNESVAQHSFFVATIVLALHNDYEFDLSRSIIGAICHDITESDLGDVSYKLRRDSKVLENEIYKVEQKVIKKYPQAIREGIDIINENSIEGYIVKLADAIQVFQYTSIEISLGNSNMIKIKEKTNERIKELMVKLEPWKK